MNEISSTLSGIASAVQTFPPEGRVQAVLDALPVGLVYADASGAILWGNRKAEDIFGHPLFPTRGFDDHGNWVCYHGDGSPVAVEDFPLVRVLRGERQAEMDVHYPRGDGRRAWIRLFASRIDDAQGEMAGGVVAILDIDAEKRAAEAAETARKRLEVAQRAGEIGTYEILPEEGRILVSEEFCKVWGLAPRSEIPVAEAEALLNPEDLVEVQNAGPYGVGRAVYRMKRPGTGETRWIVRQGEAVTGDDGRVRHFGVTYDITETKRTEEALRDREERLRAALEGSGAGTFRWDIPTGKLEFDPMLEALIGCEPGQGPKRIDERALRAHPEDRDALIAARTRSLETGADFDMEYRVLLPDGGVRWLHDRGKVYFGRDGKAAYMTGACTDVTHRAVAARRLNTVLESITDSFIAVDGEWTVTLVNKAAERFLGFSRDDVLGLNLWDAFPELRDSALAPALEAIMKDRTPRTVEMEPKRRPGTVIEVRLSPKDGGGVAASFTDVTERKKAERHRELLLGELNHRVKNTMALVQATAQQTFRSAELPDTVRRTFDGRLAALAAAHDLLTRQSWESAMLRDIVTAALAPFGALEDGRVSIDGPDVRLNAQATVAVAMALHELATNAAKYGALSNDDGKIAIAWSQDDADAGSRLRFEWTERGGPRVETPEGRGFGSRLIERALAAELSGAVALHFDPEGVRCLIDAPVADV